MEWRLNPTLEFHKWIMTQFDPKVAVRANLLVSLDYTQTMVRSDGGPTRSTCLGRMRLLHAVLSAIRHLLKRLLNKTCVVRHINI